MIPNGSFTTVPQLSTFLYPESGVIDKFCHIVRGGRDINDGTQGRDIKNWVAKYSNNSIRVLSEHDYLAGSSTGITFNVIQPESISLAFDNNMSIVLSYQKNNISNIIFLDNINQNQFITLSVPNTTSCKICTDDIRSFNNQDSDVLFFYTDMNNLYYRQQRDRYQVERIVGQTHQKINRAGMNIENRTQIELI